MKKLSLPALAALPVLLSSCATPPPLTAYQSTDSSALVIESFDGSTSRILEPAVSTNIPNNRILAVARKYPQCRTAVVILENYKGRRVGYEFRVRATPWFEELRYLGYEHIFFLLGNGVDNPEGLPVLARYD
jgi:hypothetical protein